MSKGALRMSAADVQAHQERHGFAVKRPKAPDPVKLPKPRQNATEREYGLILRAMVERGEIAGYRPFGMKLEWGADPVTGKPMTYSPDFTVFQLFGDSIRLIEVKGGYIHPQDWIRFKGCRAEWPMFRFELHQKANGEWRRLL